MSAAAPVFNPSRPLPPRNSVGGDGESSAKDEEGRGEVDVDVGAPAARQGESSAAAAATASAMAAAIAASRVTRPLPGSRRMQTGADFVPQQAAVPKSNEAKENTRRLIVVLSQVSVA
jgi:rRNA small subunit pseudouridine methyltransferase Nep1